MSAGRWAGFRDKLAEVLGLRASVQQPGPHKINEPAELIFGELNRHPQKRINSRKDRLDRPA